MTESFDPYRKWLGIPEQERPPNHYRLLGIELFESDADVISNAADGRMAQLKNYQSGKYSAYSQKLLNEIATAKVCLLHPARKAEYDRLLGERDQTKDSGGEEMMEIAGIPGFAPTHASSYAHRAGRKQSRWLMPLIVTGGAVLFIVFLAFWTRETSNDAAAKQIHATLEQSSPDTPVPAKPIVAKPAVASEKPSPAPAEKKSETPAKEPEPAQLTMKDPTPPAEEPAVEPPTEKPVATESEAEKKPQKLPVPDDAKQQAAESKIREIYGKELSGAKAADQKLGLAAKLVKQGAETGDDPDARFVLLRMACNLAAEAGELSEAFRTVDTIVESYELDPLNVKIALLAKAVEANRSGGKAEAARVKSLLDIANAISDEAMAADNFEAAGRIVKIAAAAARATKDPQLIRDIAARVRELDRLKAKFAAIKKAMDALTDDPADADANLTVGQWYCFTKGDWARGLTLLQKGSDAKLAKLAGEDLGQPKEPKTQIVLADSWWELAGGEQGQVKSALQSRAVYWYEAALPKLAGLEKLKVEKRLELLSATDNAEEKTTTVPKVRGGAIEKGNVALASNGTTVTGIIREPQTLLDGNSVNFGVSNGFASAKWPCEWTITFAKAYQLREIRFLLWDKDSRFYRYMVAISSDGKKFTPLVDRSKGEWKSWQAIDFPPRPVKAIKLYGLYSINPLFCVAEFEAYCIPPKTPK